jgi:hypothetical protein
MINSQPIQEFKSLPLRGTVGSAAGSSLVWESPRLTTMYPMEGMPKGADRAVCHTVNGFLRMTLADKSLLSSNCIVTAGLFGEYANIPGVIAFTTLPFNSSGLAFYAPNGVIGFDEWSSFSNLGQNIFIRVSIYRITEGLADTPVDVTFSGVLLGSDLRF